MVNDKADIDNWEGKTIQIYVWEVPEQLMNKLKSKWLVEIAAKNLSTKLVKFFCSKLKTGTLVTVLEDFSNLSGIWNG